MPKRRLLHTVQNTVLPIPPTRTVHVPVPAELVSQTSKVLNTLLVRGLLNTLPILIFASLDRLVYYLNEYIFHLRLQMH